MTTYPIFRWIWCWTWVSGVQRTHCFKAFIWFWKLCASRLAFIAMLVSIFSSRCTRLFTGSFFVSKKRARETAAGTFSKVTVLPLFTRRHHPEKESAAKALWSLSPGGKNDPFNETGFYRLVSKAPTLAWNRKDAWRDQILWHLELRRRIATPPAETARIYGSDSLSVENSKLLLNACCLLFGFEQIDRSSKQKGNSIGWFETGGSVAEFNYEGAHVQVTNSSYEL